MKEKNNLEKTADLGQSIWLDYLERNFMASGELGKWIEKGIRGVTSNPSIFQKAIADGESYDNQIASLVADDKSDQEIFEAVAVEDIQTCADTFLPLFSRTHETDGFVSLEVNPHLADDTEETVAEARRLFTAVNRPNVMIKVPATPAGIPAITKLISEGINVNVTLMFSLQDYDNVADAFLHGLEIRAARGERIDNVSSVASFFVSRVDTAVDKQLDQLGDNHAARYLKGKIGIANAKMAYTRYLNIASSKRWQTLAARGARPQRILYGSTSVKNPDYPDTLYADGLIGANTINTMPLSTVEQFLAHGTPAPTLTTNLDEARSNLVQLADLGISLDEITQQLQEEGVATFADAYDKLLHAIHQSRSAAEPQKSWQTDPALET